MFSPASDRVRRSSVGYDSDEPGPSSSSKNESGSEFPFSPTSNLPNFVIDGTAPHLLQISPQKYKENIDWLTKIRKEKFEQKSKTAISELTSPKAPVVAGRRSGRSRSTEPRKPVKDTSLSLLNFFRVSGKECDKDLCFAAASLISSQSAVSRTGEQANAKTENALS